MNLLIAISGVPRRLRLLPCALSSACLLDRQRQVFPQLPKSFLPGLSISEAPLPISSPLAAGGIASRMTSRYFHPLLSRSCRSTPETFLTTCRPAAVEGHDTAEIFHPYPIRSTLPTSPTDSEKKVFLLFHPHPISSALSREPIPLRTR